jgi:hypothetical protein
LPVDRHHRTPQLVPHIPRDAHISDPRNCGAAVVFRPVRARVRRTEKITALPQSPGSQIVLQHAAVLGVIGYPTRVVRLKRPGWSPGGI